jgi:ribonuclease J
LIDLEFEFFRVTHSIPDALGLAIRTPLGLIVHSGDFRVDTSPTMGEPFDKEALIRYGDEGVFLLLSDSTNAEVPGHTHGEQIVSDNLLQAISSHPGRVLVSLFSSNVERIGLLAAIADRTHRRLGMVGRSLHSYSRAALESGFAPFDPNSLVDPHYVSDIPNENLLLLIAGSQGESRSALTRVSTGEHADVRIRTDDLIIYSSKVIPGNEKAIQRVSNDLARSGAKVLHEGNANVHTSGHACRDELKKVLEWVRPKHFIPVHGEYRFLLEHARLARETVGAKTLVVDWGEVIEVDKDGPSRVEQLDLEHYFVERPLIGNAEDLKLRERRKLMYNGLVTVHCKLTKRKRGVTVDSDVTLYGVPDPDENLVAAIKDRLRLEFNNRSTGLSEATISEEIRILTRRVVRKAHGHKPLVHVFLEGSISPSQ